MVSLLLAKRMFESTAVLVSSTVAARKGHSSCVSLCGEWVGETLCDSESKTATVEFLVLAPYMCQLRTRTCVRRDRPPFEMDLTF